jgi:hypothetical protein
MRKYRHALGWSSRGAVIIKVQRIDTKSGVASNNREHSVFDSLRRVRDPLEQKPQKRHLK